jgi:hypothetical protein
MWVLLVGLTMIVSACGAEDQTDLDAALDSGAPQGSLPVAEAESEQGVTEPSTRVGTVDGPVLVSPLPDSDELGGMAAEVRGILVFDADTGCLLLELEGVRYPLVWPAGTSWSADAAGVRLDTGEMVEPGMTVHGGGGYLQRGGIEHVAGAAVADAAAVCAGPTGEIAIFNPGSTVTIVSG